MKYLIFMLLLFSTYNITLSQANINILNLPLLNNEQSLAINPANSPVNINLSQWAGFDGEPSLAVNPSNPNNIIAGWMSLRLDGRIWIVTRSSTDGGSTWGNIQFIPHQASGYGSADVMIVFNTSGVAYLTFIDFRLSPDTTGGVYITSSTDGGTSWSSAVKVFDAGESADLPLDRPWLSIDNSGGSFNGRIYVTTMSAYWYAGMHKIYCKYSTNGGSTWSGSTRIDNDSSFSVGISKVSYGVPSVGASSRLCAAYMSYDTAISPFIRVISSVSNNGGMSFQRNFAGYAFPLDTNYARLWSYSIAADPVRSGNIIILWADNRLGDLDIMTSRSTNGGINWTSPYRVNDDPVSNGKAQELVWSSFSPNGNYTAGWRDRRNISGSADSFEVYIALSTNGGAGFLPNYKMSSGRSKNQKLPCCNSFLGVAAGNNFIYTDWADLREGNWEIYFAGENINNILPVKKIYENIPDKYELYQNYPNPFNPVTKIKFDVAPPLNPALSEGEAVNVKLVIYDITGKEIVYLVNEQLMPGTYEVDFDGNNYSSGIYIYKLYAGDYTEVKKMSLIK